MPKRSTKRPTLVRTTHRRREGGGKRSDVLGEPNRADEVTLQRRVRSMRRKDGEANKRKLVEPRREGGETIDSTDLAIWLNKTKRAVREAEPAPPVSDAQ